MPKVINASVYKLAAPKNLVVEQEPLPEVGLGMIRAGTLYSAVSPGTEIAAYNGVPPLRPMKEYPRLVGYCNVAQVEEVGLGVDSTMIGDLIYSHQSHRSAFVCPVGSVMPLPDGCDPMLMSTAYLFHLGYSALLAGRHQPGESVAVVGLGTLGVSAVAVAKLCGANVLGVSNYAEGGEAAMMMGAREVIAKGAEGDPLAGTSFAPGVDLVVLTSNSWDDYRLALEIVRVGGRVGLVGFPGREQPIPPFNPLDSRYVYDKQLTLFACGHVADQDVPVQDIRFTLKRNMEFLTDKIHRGELDPHPILSRSIPSTELGDTYEDMSSRKPGLFSAVLSWENSL